MTLDETNLTIDVADGSFNAYLARPWKAGPAPVVVVVQEVNGLDEDLRETCNRLADEGFIAVAPNLFWRDDPGPDLTSWNDSDWGRGLALYQAYDFDRGVRDLDAVIRVARSMPGATGRVGVMGFCLGGLMAYLTAARCCIDAAAAYCGGGIDQHLDEAWRIEAPLIIHLAEQDESIPDVARERIVAGVAKRSNISVFTYPGTSHAFTRQTGAQFDVGASAEANARTYLHFDRTLRWRSDRPAYADRGRAHFEAPRLLRAVR